ncbi:hypothetical protein ABMA27_005847 [Loxostege sticticalis]|uniref:Uncharacterized protein n=1 Tax=Loxostege sticticalis TaxID=481309 RepID=A0ABR3HGP2_LOXSC
MNNFVGTLTLFLTLKYAESYTVVNGCTNTENRTGCYYDVNCVGPVDQLVETYARRQNPYIRHHAYVDQMYDESGMPIPADTTNECSSDDYIHLNGISYNKIHLKYKETHIEDSEDVPQDNLRSMGYGGYSRSAVQLIVHLDLSNNEYGSAGPNLKAMQYLSFLNLSNNYLTTARLYNHLDLPLLTDLDLSYNMINAIEASSPSQPVNVYRNLKNLNMSHNYLVDIPDAVLDSFTQLETLDLSHNYIDSLSISTFEGIKKLNSLFLSDNRITDINYSFFRFSDLTVLDLSHNRIESLKLHDFEKLTKLETIDLSSNSLVNIESSVFWNMNSLVSLNLHDNKLKVINKDIFANASSLKSVDISQNSFNVLPRGLFRGMFINHFAVNGNNLKGSLTSGTFEGLGYVDSLDLSHQHLTSIEDNAFLGLTSIKTLLLNNNEIQSLSKNSFRGLRNLNTLDLSHNNITDINFDAQDLVHLRSIVLSYNFLTQIKQENFQGLHLLQFLDLSNNKISQFESNSFKSLRDLVNFEVSNNPLTGSLEERTFDGLYSLPSLVISCTQLTTIKNGSFIGMTQLKELNMSQSKINELQYNAFINTGAIEEIDLSYNQLRVFDINSTELINLRVLLLHKNLLKTISQITFFGLSRLTTLNLGHNNIKDINYEAFESQKDLVHLDLSYNLDIVFNDSFILKNTNLRNLYLSGIRNGVSFTKIEDTQLTDLEVCYSGLSNVTAINLRGLSRLENVKLSNNDVVRLEVGAFTNVTQLRSLDMSYNKLTFIQPGVFKDNIRLHTLNISHNSLMTVSYGIFRGLIYLNTLDMSYNSITSLESERFYEVRSLSTLIVDHNKIDSLNAEDFVGTSLTTLSIGGNPLPCEILVNFKKNSVSFAVTAIKIDEHTDENVDGVTCNMNGYTYKKKSNTSKETTSDESARILNDIRDLLSKMTQQPPVSTTNTSNDKAEQKRYFEYLMNISKQIEKISLKTDNNLSHLSNSTLIVAEETNQTNVLLEKILNALNRKVVQTTTHFPISKDNATNDLVMYINKVREDLEDTLAAEKLNIFEELEKKISELKTQINTSTEISKGPSHDKLLGTKEDNEVSNASSTFTETCVALILIILVCFVLYKFYKSRMFVRASRSYSTRELPGSMESQNL